MQRRKLTRDEWRATLDAFVPDMDRPNTSAEQLVVERMEQLLPHPADVPASQPAPAGGRGRVGIASGGWGF